MTEPASDRFYVGSRPLYVGAGPYLTVTAATHPLVFAAFETIAYDSGFGCGRGAYSVPLAWAERMQRAETELALLPDDDARSEFIIGDQDQAEETASDLGLGTAHDLLNDFFDGPEKTFEPREAVS